MTSGDAAMLFHHVGVACDDIRSEQSHFESLGYIAESETFEDAAQGVRGIFMAAQSPRIEILEPIDGSRGVLSIWLSRGVKLYHLAYTVPDLDAAIAGMRAKRAKLMVPPVPAVGFGGRMIAFVMLPNRLLVELISRE